MVGIPPRPRRPPAPPPATPADEVGQPCVDRAAVRPAWPGREDRLRGARQAPATDLLPCALPVPERPPAPKTASGCRGPRDRPPPTPPAAPIRARAPGAWGRTEG